MRKLSGILLLLCTYAFASAQLTMKKSDDGIIIVDGEKNVLKYQSEPKSKDGKYERCNYIHPLWGADGKVLTEDFPGDHLHHRGVFWAWHQVWIGNKRIGDPWEIKDFEQEVVELEFIKQSSGEIEIKTEVEWKSNQWKIAGIKKPYMLEKGLITVHPISGNVRKIDFRIELLALAEGLKIGGSEDKKGYSGFSVRLDLPNEVKFSGDNGIIKPEVTAVESEGYVNISGGFCNDNRNGGIAIIDNPDNPGYPQQWILREKNSMQNAAWPGRKTVAISTVEPVVLKYSLLVYSGKLSNKKIDRLTK